jgi:hypothetical protein
MTSIDDNTTPPPSVPPPPDVPAAGPEPGFFDRVIGVLMSPGETFQWIARKPDWVAPLATFFVIWLVSGILASTHIDYQGVAREAMEANPRAAQMSQDQIDTAVRINAAVFKVLAYIGPLLFTVVLLIAAAALLFSFRLFGSEINFKQAFAVTIYAWLPRVIKGIIAVIVTMTRSTMSFIDIQNPVMSNLGFLADPKSNPVLYAMASSIDIFSIWTVVLLIIGFAVAAKVSKGKSAGIVIGWWVVINLVSLIGPAMQTLRK